MQIRRRRFVIMRKKRTEIWCGLAKNFYFKDINEVGDTAIKTYRTVKKAISGCSSWARDFEVVPVIESIEVLADET